MGCFLYSLPIKIVLRHPESAVITALRNKDSFFSQFLPICPVSVPLLFFFSSYPTIFMVNNDANSCLIHNVLSLYTVGGMVVCCTIHLGFALCSTFAMLQDSCTEIQLCPNKPKEAKRP